MHGSEVEECKLNVDDDTGDPVKLDDVLEDIGLGSGQTFSFAVVFWVLMASSMHLFLLFYFPKEMAAEWGSTVNQISWMDTLSFFGAFIGWIPGRLTSDFFGRRPTVLLSTLLVSCLSFYSAYARNFTELCVFRILLGVAIGMTGPAASSLAMELSPPQALAVALVGCSASAGRILLALLAFALDSGWTYEHAASWRAVVVLCSFLSLAGLVLAVYNLPESP
eukprot:CAMPEP_0172157652 /NCGR_PEP_ID=MMETSP1050-20130122/3915_1 /TAXON_ID=233186 /ORGANISM="Cryptomonas curvata, Strain CCAP979/52" /LENGTH=221 /DNA_ID=CAMNT_0012826915 /DNA_START=126 /DNA_END=789 /DNA_ORIENTATION=-